MKFIEIYETLYNVDKIVSISHCCGDTLLFYKDDYNPSFVIADKDKEIYKSIIKLVEPIKIKEIV